MNPRARLTLAVAVAVVGGVGEFVHRRRSVPDESPPPLTTQSSPGQIADLQQAYGADMAPRPYHEDPTPG